LAERVGVGLQQTPPFDLLACQKKRKLTVPQRSRPDRIQRHETITTLIDTAFGARQLNIRLRESLFGDIFHKVFPLMSDYTETA
jgi:hypothetical protein